MRPNAAVIVIAYETMFDYTISPDFPILFSLPCDFWYHFNAWDFLFLLPFAKGHGYCYIFPYGIINIAYNMLE